MEGLEMSEKIRLTEQEIDEIVRRVIEKIKQELRETERAHGK